MNDPDHDGFEHTSAGGKVYYAGSDIAFAVLLCCQD